MPGLHSLPAAVFLESRVLAVLTDKRFLAWGWGGLQMGFVRTYEPLKMCNLNLMSTYIFCKEKEGPIVFI